MHERKVGNLNNYITGAAIRQRRLSLGMTQAELAQRLDVSDKAISRWETSRGLPDITLIEPLAKALGISVAELMTGNCVANRNRSGNLLRSKLYVCPICGNILHATGEATISCCGTPLPPLEAEEPDEAHTIHCSRVEDEWLITVDHPMTKEHHISFLAMVTTDRFHLVKLYPEGSAEARFSLRGHGWLYLYCNHHGLMKIPIGTGTQRKS